MRVVLLGAGGHARVVVEALRAMGIEPALLLDARRELFGTTLLGVPIEGDDGALADERARGATHFVVTVGGVRASDVRRALFARARDAGLAPLSVVHPSAIVSPSARVAAGVTVLARAVVNACAVIDENAILNTGAIVEHDVTVCAHAHVASGAVVASGAHVGEGAHIGAGAVVRQLARVGARATVGAGAVVVEDVADGALVVGVPARPRA